MAPRNLDRYLKARAVALALEKAFADAQGECRMLHLRLTGSQLGKLREPSPYRATVRVKVLRIHDERTI